MPFIAQWPDANIRFDSITTVIKDKLVKISQAAIDRYLKKDRAACAIYGNPQRQKSHQTGRFPEIPYPYQNLLNALLSSFREFPSDNGSEFINHVVTDWYCNAACVREYTGYDRIEGETLQSCLAEAYRYLVLIPNFLCPGWNLKAK